MFATKKFLNANEKGVFKMKTKNMGTVKRLLNSLKVIAASAVVGFVSSTSPVGAVSTYADSSPEEITFTQAPSETFAIETHPTWLVGTTATSGKTITTTTTTTTTTATTTKTTTTTTTETTTTCTEVVTESATVAVETTMPSYNESEIEYEEVSFSECTNSETDTYDYEIVDYSYSEETVNVDTANSTSVSDSDYILLCNAVAHEAGSNWISTESKACVCEVIMNRVYSSAYPDTIYGVLTQNGQFSGCWGYVDLGCYSSYVTDDVQSAVTNFLNGVYGNHGYYSFWGDGYQNHFS